MKIDPKEFLAVVHDPLAAGDAAALADAVRERWPARALCELLHCPQCDVRRVVAVALGLIGDPSCLGPLTRALHDADEQVNEMAEHGLWSIWFRASRPAAARPFHEGVALVSMECYQEAVDKFAEAAAIDPDFAEAHNQSGIARFLLGQWQSSLRDSEQAVLRMPGHFGAISGMGHCYAHLNDLEQALDCYRGALAINPRMPAIARAVHRLEVKLLGKPAHARSRENT